MLLSQYLSFQFSLIETDTSKLVATHTDSGDSTPTETKSLVPSGPSVPESLKPSPSTEEVSKEPIEVDKAVEEESLKTEKPPPYSIKDPLMPVADSESGGLVMKAATAEDKSEEITPVVCWILIRGLYL